MAKAPQRMRIELPYYMTLQIKPPKGMSKERAEGLVLYDGVTIIFGEKRNRHFKYKIKRYGKREFGSSHELILERI